MELPSKHVLYLSKRIGARGAGSDGEAAAASYVLRSFGEYDLDVDMETFSSWKSDTHGLVIIYLLAIAAFLLFRVSYSLSLALAVIVFFIFQMETYTWAVTSRLLPRSNASNVIGLARPSGSSKQKVLLVANYDTPKSSPFGRPKLARAYRLIYILSFICIIAILVVGVVGVGATLTKVSKDAVTTVWIFSSPFALYLLVLAAMMLFGETRGRYTAGANDNASGVGVMLSVMANIADKPLENTEVWGIATGRNGAGARGMIAFLHRHKHTMRGAYIINVDHCGVGDMKVVTREGTMFGFRCSRRLKRMTMEASRRSKQLELSRGKNRVKKSDAMAALVRGYKAISIGNDAGGRFVGWKNKNDTLDTLDRETLDRTAKLVRFLLEEIDHGSRTRRLPRERPVKEEPTDETIEEGETAEDRDEDLAPASD